MRITGHTPFSTSIGLCAVAWSDGGLTGVWLPEERDDLLRDRLKRQFGESASPSREVQAAIDAISALLRGQRCDLSHIALDMSAHPDFHRRVYGFARTIAPGQTRTYGEVAAALGDPGAARAVGQALGRNPFAIVVPCHRVLAAGGRAGGFSAPGGTATKLRLLEIEGALEFPLLGH